MINELILILSFTVLFFSLISNKLHNTIITLPIAFTFTGFIFGSDLMDLVNIPLSSGLIRFFAEVALVLVLYSDASRISLDSVRKHHNIPVRLLLIGLPLTVIFGCVLAKFLFSDFSWFEAALIAAILAPTDAALIHTVVSYEKVPIRIRQALNIESGLNDGLMLPVIIALLSFINTSIESLSMHEWLLFILMQIPIGIAIGILVGYFGGKISESRIKKRWMNKLFEELFAIALAFLTYSLAQITNGNGFIAVFVCGLMVRKTSKTLSAQISNFAAAEGQLLVLILFFFFGSSFLGSVLASVNWKIFLYSVLSLTVVRMIPVFLSIIGCKLKFETFFYLGWFGPRGIASIVFTFLMIEKIESDLAPVIFSIAITTIFLSILLHGITSLPLAKWYSKKLYTKERKEEHKKVSEMPTRLRP